MSRILSRQVLAEAFAAMGLRAGESVIVHSSLRSLGEVEGGADAVLDALLDVISPSGNLMLPTFNYSRPLPVPYFDPATTPARTGILPERARLRANAKRSLHPTHSVAVIGADASDLTQSHLRTRAFGVGSPIDLLASRGGKILLIGVGQMSNSTLHIAEDHAQIPKAGVYKPPPVVGVLQAGGSVIKHRLDASTSCSAAFEAASFSLRGRGAIQDARVGNSMMQIMKGADVIEIICDVLKSQPDALLCNNPTCATCPGTRTNLGLKNQAVPISSKAIIPDSELSF